MIDLSETIEPNSQQLNADDLLGGPKTVTVTKVTKGTADQPIWVYYEGDNGRPWKPCKSMRRLLVKMWGKDGDGYAGKSLTLFCDPTVTFGPDAVGGIRVSHMSHIERDETLMLTASRGKKKPYQVRKMVAAPKQKASSGDPEQLAGCKKLIDDAADLEAVNEVAKGFAGLTFTRAEKAELREYVQARRDSFADEF